LRDSASLRDIRHGVGRLFGQGFELAGHAVQPNQQLGLSQRRQQGVAPGLGLFGVREQLGQPARLLLKVS
jgi:hypothetical protein